MFYVTIADSDFGSLKSLHLLFDKYLDHMQVRFKQNRIVGTIQIYSFLTKKWWAFFGKVFTPFWRRSCDWNSCLMLKY